MKAQHNAFGKVQLDRCCGPAMVVSGEVVHEAARFHIDLILKGANPATLPFQQPTCMPFFCSFERRDWQTHPVLLMDGSDCYFRLLLIRRAKATLA
jgi:hypothetical protein